MKTFLTHVVLGLMLASFATAAQAQDCSRQCLAGMLDRYFGALTAHDRAKAPLAESFRQTENAVVKAPDEGLWRDATGLGPLQRRFFDPATDTAAYFGTLLLQHGETAIVGLRLHVKAGRIDEAEWHVTRASDPGIAAGAKATFDLANLLANPPPDRVVPLKERSVRDTLIAIANSYFDGITGANRKVIRGHPGCLRLENGMGFDRPLAPDEVWDGYNGHPDCMSGQGKFGVAFVAGRRFPMVDEAAQVVLVIGTFIREPNNPKRRNHFMEFFFVDHGRIRQVYAAFFYPPASQPVPNWPPYEGNFPLPADFGAGR